MSLRTLIREIIESERRSSGMPKGEWIALTPDDHDYKIIRHQLYNLINTAYGDMKGGHIKISGRGPESLDRYRFWVVLDHDRDPDVDVAIFGKPEFGTKSGGVGHDGTKPSIDLYKQKSADLRKGQSIGGIGNWWGEVSGRAAYALLRRGAPAVESAEKVAELLGDDRYEWHGEHPDPNAPPLFKSVRGWYTKWFDGKPHTKIIVGNPS